MHNKFKAQKIPGRCEDGAPVFFGYGLGFNEGWIERQ
jgi:hypothetical protein